MRCAAMPECIGISNTELECDDIQIGRHGCEHTYREQTTMYGMSSQAQRAAAIGIAVWETIVGMSRVLCRCMTMAILHLSFAYSLSPEINSPHTRKNASGLRKVRINKFSWALLCKIHQSNTQADGHLSLAWQVQCSFVIKGAIHAMACPVVVAIDGIRKIEIVGLWEAQYGEKR